MSESDKLPFSLFTTEHLRPRDPFEAWYASISVIFDTAPLSECRPEGGTKQFYLSAARHQDALTRFVGILTASNIGQFA